MDMEATTAPNNIWTIPQRGFVTPATHPLSGIVAKVSTNLDGSPVLRFINLNRSTLESLSIGDTFTQYHSGEGTHSRAVEVVGIHDVLNGGDYGEFLGREMRSESEA